MSTLHIECACRQFVEDLQLLQTRVETFIRSRVKYFELGDTFKNPMPNHTHDLLSALEYIQLSDCETLDVPQSPNNALKPTLELVHFQVFRCHFFVFDESMECDLSDHFGTGQPIGTRTLLFPTSTNPDDSEHRMICAKTINLPHRTLAEAWNALVFEDSLHRKILNYLIRRVHISAKRIKHGGVSPWSHAILLHGPTGTGKTSLCRALAQQIAIRLNDLFPTSRMITLESSSIFSKWFSESGKAISRLFELIETMLQEDQPSLIFILIDEIESLASNRDPSASAGDPKDAMRAVNALLVAMDRLRRRHNVLLLCTSNLLDAIDPAFRDRVDDKWYIGNPNPAARYEILRRDYSELAAHEIIKHEAAPVTYDSSARYPSLPSTDQSLPLFSPLQPLATDTQGTAITDLRMLAQACEGMSGRALRNLPEKTLSLLPALQPCTLRTAVEAAQRFISNNPH